MDSWVPGIDRLATEARRLTVNVPVNQALGARSRGPALGSLEV